MDRLTERDQSLMTQAALVGVAAGIEHGDSLIAMQDFCKWLKENESRLAKEAPSEEKIVQVNGFSYGPPEQLAYLLVGVTDSGRVVMSTGDKNWTDVSPEPPSSEATENAKGVEEV